MQNFTQGSSGSAGKRINVNDIYAVNVWTKEFGVTREVLKKAVKQVGSNAYAVEQFLKCDSKADDVTGYMS